MPLQVNNKTTEPPGVLPPKLKFFVLIAIVALVVITSVFSGRTAKQPSNAVPSATAGPSPIQLSMFEQLLKKQRDAEDEKTRVAKQLQEMDLNHRPSQMGMATSYAEHPPAVPAPAVDPFEVERRRREERAPFADNIVINNPPANDGHPANERKFEPSAEVAKAAPDPTQERSAAASPKNLGSGRYLPERENGLFRIYEGTFIETTLVNRLDGSFTGPVKCVVSREVRSRDGEALLIPKGSQFLGEAKKVDAAGQTRLAVSFKRLLLPDGYSVDLEDTPGLSEQGETGLKDKRDSHYLRTLGITGVVGLLGGLSLYGGQAGATQYANGVANAEGSAATTILNRSLNQVPTITIREGHEVKVYLSTDLQMPEYRP